ncbi:MAG: class I SAM-dependent methyltransferase [Actinomyces sp.]|nr:MAG: class I SAM-dependent methyltransferase [Actinomyces sp.]
MDSRLLPDDVHALGPATFAELGPEVAEAAVVWGAAKAHLHRRRHGRPGGPSLGSAPVPDAASPTEPTAGTPGGGSLPDLTGVEGWLTLEQAERLRRAAAAVPPGGRIVEIGSFRGRSTIVLATAAADGVEVIAIDPHGGGDRGPQEIAPDPVRGDADHAAFVANLERAGVAGRVRHVRSPSDRAHPHVADPLDLLYVDGAHRFGPARHDLAAWGDRVRPGGLMLVHDAFSSIGVTLALWTTTAVSGRWRHRGRVGSLAAFERVEPTRWGRLAQVGWHLAQMPWFARNVAVKVLLSVGLGRLTPLLGHRSGDWPY